MQVKSEVTLILEALGASAYQLCLTMPDFSQVLPFNVFPQIVTSQPVSQTLFCREIRVLQTEGAVAGTNDGMTIDNYFVVLGFLGLEMGITMIPPLTRQTPIYAFIAKSYL